MTDNGTHVTWRELKLLRETIDTKFDQLEADVTEIKWSLNVVLENKRTRWRTYAPAIIAALVSAAIALPVAFFH